MEKRINNVGSYFFIIVAFITPLIFSISPSVSFPLAKMIPFLAVVFFGIFLLILSSFHEGKFTVPKHAFFIAALLVPFSYILSSLFSVDKSASLIGTGAGLATASTITALFLFMYLVSLFVRSKNKIFISYFVFILAYLLIALFHILRLFFGVDFLSFDIFTAMISNVVGRWTDIGLFSGIAILISLTSIEFLRLEKPFKILAYVVLGVSLFMLAVTNFPVLVWGANAQNTLSLFTLIGFFALIFFVYFVSSSYDQSNKKAAEESEPKKVVRKIPVASLVVLVISIIFTLGFLPLQSVVANFFKIEPVVETRLLWKPTLDLSVSTITQGPFYRPIVGYGPEQFSYKWMLDKPQGINNTTIWNANFNEGTGFIPSTVVTVGLLGFLSWVAFLVLFVLLGVRALFMKIKDPFSHYLTVSSFLVSLYLWIVQVIYTPSAPLLIFTFFFTGLFLASLYREKVLVEKEYVFEKSKGKSFVSIMSLILFLMLVLFWGYKIGERAVAAGYAGKAEAILQSAQSMEDVERAKVYIQNAAALSNEDSYFRALANVSLAQVNGLLQDTSTPAEELRSQFQQVYEQALGAAGLAVRANPQGYDNYVTLGNVLEAVVPLNVPDAYENAKIAYEEAGRLNPKSPLVPYLLARLEVAHNNISVAKERIGESLALKPYYLDAVILLGRIQLGEGNEEAALNSFQVAQTIAPGNADIAQIIKMIQNGSASVNTQPDDTSTSTDETGVDDAETEEN